MIADWSVAAGADDPWIVVPWEGWVDVREAPVQDLAEVRAWPELAALLPRVNAGAMLSAKVDVFEVEAADADPELGELWGAEQLCCGLGSYLDVLCAHAASLDFAAWEQRTRQMVQGLRKMELHAPACAELVLRPALLHGGKGWGWSLYAMGFGPAPGQARVAWAHAAAAVVQAAQAVLLEHVGE